MRDLTLQAVQESETRDCAINISRAASVCGQGETILAIREFVRTRMQLVADPGELLIHPVRMIREIYSRGFVAGDCDDAAVLVAALLASIGFQVRFRAILPRGDGSFQHVFAEVYRPAPHSEWVPIDPTVTYFSRRLWLKYSTKKQGRARAEETGQTIVQAVN